MRRLTLAAVAMLGLGGGAGCQEREEARMASPPAEERALATQEARELTRDIPAEGSTAAERAVANPLLGSVSGTVARTSGDALQLHEAGGKRVVLTTDGQTRVVRNGQPLGLEALQPGTEVRASYVIDGEEWRARQVDVVPPATR
ncbi:hypothetical protein [Archangium sp.]|uniref:hypothetical protein n=1 Tax=Archangium sp. TaxID=1872627 RepID=UPI002D375D82|nr:hypothetical protein [Archangium sp.]HYO56147.1 hypothetical protein [Archangium sp.]